MAASAMAAGMIALLSACGGGGGGSDSGAGAATGDGAPAVRLSADFYPLGTGDRRTWRINGGSLFHERVGAVTTLASGTGLAVSAGTPTDVSVDYLQRSGTEIVKLLSATADPVAVLIGSVPLLRFGMALGETVILVDRKASADLDGDGRADSVDLRVDSTFVAVETVSTPAGTFPGCAHVRTVRRSTVRLGGISGSSSATQTEDTWYAPGIGPVKISSSDETDGIADGSGTAELIAYSAGSQHSESVAPTVVSTDPAGGGLVRWNSTVRINFSEPIDPLGVSMPDGFHLFNSAGVALDAYVTLDDSLQQLTITLPGNLPQGRYTVRAGSAATDLAGNPLSEEVLSFTFDNQGPQLISSSPALNAWDVPTSTTTLRMSYSEPIAGFGSLDPVKVRLTAEDGSVWELPVTVDGSEIIALLPQPLAPDMYYFATLSAEPNDAAGNYGASTYIGFHTGSNAPPKPAGVATSAIAPAASTTGTRHASRANQLLPSLRPATISGLTRPETVRR